MIIISTKNVKLKCDNFVEQKIPLTIGNNEVGGFIVCIRWYLIHPELRVRFWNPAAG